MRARQIIVDMEDRVKAMIEQYKKLESTRDDLVSELKRLAGEVLEKVERTRGSSKSFDADQHFANVRREASKAAFPNHDFETQVEKDEMPERQEVVAEPQPGTAEPPRRVQKSFFDGIG